MSEAPMVIELAVATTAVALAIVQLFVHRALVRLADDEPEVMRRAGIRDVDWWFRCIRGLFLLAFGDVSQSLPGSTRILFRSFWLGLVSLVMALVFMFQR